MVSKGLLIIKHPAMGVSPWNPHLCRLKCWKSNAETKERLVASLWGLASCIKPFLKLKYVCLRCSYGWKMLGTC